MAEHGVDDPVWDDDPVHCGPVDPVALGAGAELAGRLRAWNARFTATARTGFAFPGGADEERAWQREGLHLAYALQDELPDVAVRYHHDGDERPVRERRGR